MKHHKYYWKIDSLRQALFKQVAVFLVSPSFSFKFNNWVFKGKTEEKRRKDVFHKIWFFYSMFWPSHFRHLFSITVNVPLFFNKDIDTKRVRWLLSQKENKVKGSLRKNGSPDPPRWVIPPILITPNFLIILFVTLQPSDFFASFVCTCEQVPEIILPHFTKKILNYPPFSLHQSRWS